MTANLLLDCDMAPEAPRCWNRPPAERVRVRHGIDSETGQPIAVTVRDDWSSAQCRTWDGVGIGQPTPEYPSGTPYPVAMGWADWCRSCRHRPVGVGV